MADPILISLFRRLELILITLLFHYPILFPLLTMGISADGGSYLWGVTQTLISKDFEISMIPPVKLLKYFSSLIIRYDSNRGHPKDLLIFFNLI